MDIFLIKKDSDNNSNLIEDYFFEFIEDRDYKEKSNYFIKNNLVEFKIDNNNSQYSNFYFNLPFVILNRILKSIEKISGEYILKSMFIPNIIWTNEYFCENNIMYFQKKYEIFKLLTQEIEFFNECFKTKRQIQREEFEHLCDFFIQIQDDYANECGYIKHSEYFTKENSSVVFYYLFF